MKRTLIKILQKTASKILEPTVRGLASSRQTQILLSLKYREAAARKEMLNFDDVGFDVYSTTNEDGILLYIFSLIGTTNKKCVDIGSGSVMGSSVANLIMNQGFTGLLVDGNPRNIEIAKEFYLTQIEDCLTPPTLISAMVTAEGINGLLEKHEYTGEVDLFCLDIDGVDYWIWKALEIIQPRVVVVEYQDLLGPTHAWTVPYNPSFSVADYPVNKENNNYCGASLQAFVKLGRQKGYRLVGCNKGGWNAFFMRDGVGEDFFPEVSVQCCLQSSWNQYGTEHRFPLVKDMEWVEV